MLDYLKNLPNNEGLINTIVGGTIVGVLLIIISRVIRFFKREEPTKVVITDFGEIANCYNEPKNIINKMLMGREDTLLTVFTAVRKGVVNSFVGSHVYITGREGSGKTHFSQNLFENLKKQEINMGWIECNKFESIFAIIRRDFSGFERKKTEDILTFFKNSSKPCVLFVDNIGHYTPLDEIKSLMECCNTTVVASGLLKQIDFISINNRFILNEIDCDVLRNIFEDVAKERIVDMRPGERRSAKKILNIYAKGNPYLASAFGGAKIHYKSWSDMFEKLLQSGYAEGDNYIRTILWNLYKIGDLEVDDRKFLTILSIFSATRFPVEMWSWFGISSECISRLCRTYWLTHEYNEVLFSMDEIHKGVIKKLFKEPDCLEEIVSVLTNCLPVWETTDNRFSQIASYAEEILVKVKGYNHPFFKDENIFSQFTFSVALGYIRMNDFEKSIVWLENCDPKEEETRAFKEIMQYFVKLRLMLAGHPSYTRRDVKEVYNSLKTLTMPEQLKEPFSYIAAIHDTFVLLLESPNDMKKACEEYRSNGIHISDGISHILFIRYLLAAMEEGDDEILEQLICEKNIAMLLQKTHGVNVSSLLSLEAIGLIAIILQDADNNTDMANACKRRFVICLNRLKGFAHPDIENIIGISGNTFTTYMHSHPELEESLKEAVTNEDESALYLEGNYQEHIGNYSKAIEMYETAARQGSIRSMCSFARLCYQGSKEIKDFTKARELLEYCCERKHDEAFYLLGIMLRDSNYGDHDECLAKQALEKAAELGNELAKQELQKHHPSIIPFDEIITRASQELPPRISPD